MHFMLSRLPASCVRFEVFETYSFAAQSFHLPSLFRVVFLRGHASKHTAPLHTRTRGIYTILGELTGKL
jgi:hypothetical protein